MRESKHRKQVAFDLSQKSLAENYPKPDGTENPQFFKKAYGDISRFMEQNGFEHRQFSVYVSREKLMISDVNLLIEKLAMRMPWLAACINQLDVTDVGRQHSLIETLRDTTVNHRVELEHVGCQHTQDDPGLRSAMAKLNPVTHTQEQPVAHDKEQEWTH